VGIFFASHYNNLVTDLGKLLITLGVLLACIGGLILLAGRAHLPLGKLPGDIEYHGKNTTIYFPIVTCIIISVVLSLILYIIGRMHR
jgi:hypothetical protein